VTPIDRTRPFLPEGLTPLAHTAIYGDLTARQRCRYNQLHAVYINEQILFFEKTLAASILTAALRDDPPAPLARSLSTFLADEARHSEMFRAFNRAAEPDRYGARDGYFVRIPPAAERVLRAAGGRPRMLPLFVWLMLLLEERAVHYAREIVRARATLAPAFVALHRRHLADEVHHVRWDQALLDHLWPRAPRLVRRANARLFRWLVGEFFNVPKRASLRVVDELARELPELGPRVPEMRRQMTALAGEVAYHRSLYARHIVPRSFARFDAAPELHAMRRVLAAYEPWPVPVKEPPCAPDLARRVSPPPGGWGGDGGGGGPE